MWQIMKRLKDTCVGCKISIPIGMSGYLELRKRKEENFGDEYMIFYESTFYNGGKKVFSKTFLFNEFENDVKVTVFEEGKYYIALDEESGEIRMESYMK